MSKIQIYPSIISANFLNLKANLENAINNGIKTIHYDVMDNNFVPNITMGPKILENIHNQFPKLNIDIHFMISLKKKSIVSFLQSYLNTGVIQIAFHFEALKTKQIYHFIEFCKINNIKSFLAVNPNTDWKKIKKFLNKLDGILFMTVFPGFGGQKFIVDVVDKINSFNNFKLKNKLNTEIEVDGGINSDTFKNLNNEIINYAVVGSYLFGEKDFSTKFKRLIDAK
ncbi:ribulose-phosphate 3-epimerase [Spiroplasma endosymbiont of Labia minor]|uniref:ribulose-phosphate 3-epimerase n=1 Tax=Spiroplasma endosymbiont of Labia minor TaxID=3066305 RepID=UPI0030D3CAB1